MRHEENMFPFAKSILKITATISSGRLACLARAKPDKRSWLWFIALAHAG